MTIFALIIFLAPTLASDLKPRGEIVGIFEDPLECVENQKVAVEAFRKVSNVGDIASTCMAVELDPGRFRRS
jgi:hypothetical protein